MTDLPKPPPPALASLHAVTAQAFVPAELSDALQAEISETHLRQKREQAKARQRWKKASGVRGIPKAVWAMAEVPGERWTVMVPEVGWFRVQRAGDGVTVSPAHPRHYGTSDLPTLAGRPPKSKEREVLLALFGEVNASWRTLTDIRFKLLGLLPGVSLVAWAALLTAEGFEEGAGAVAGALLAVVGAVLSGAFRLYDRRNDELYDDLISRGRRIETDLGVDTGLFRGRRTPEHPRVNHFMAVTLVYRTVLAAWLGVAVWFLLRALDLIG